MVYNLNGKGVFKENLETLVASCYLDFSYMFTNEIELIYDGFVFDGILTFQI